MARVIPVVLSIGLTIFALADCVQTEDAKVRGIPKWAWILLVVLIPWVGPIPWLLVGKDRSPGAGGERRTERREGPLAPDDDPEFLRDLDEQIRRERRQREQEQRSTEEQDGDADASGGGTPR